MSRSPQDIINGLYGAFAQGDIPTIVAMVAEDVDWRVPENLPHGGAFHGRDGVLRFFQGLGEAWDELELTRDVLMSDGDRVLAVVSIHGLLRSSGQQSGYRSVHAWTVRDDAAVRFEEYVDAPVDLPAAHAVAS